MILMGATDWKLRQHLDCISNLRTIITRFLNTKNEFIHVELKTFKSNIFNCNRSIETVEFLLI